MRKTKLFAMLMSVIMLASALCISSFAAATDISDQVKFIYVYEDLANPTSIIRSDAIKIEAEDFVAVEPKDPGTGMRVCPEDAYFMIWPEGTTEECKVTYEINVKEAGTYEMIIVGTAVRAKETDSRRGVAWWLEGGQKYQVDCEPIISHAYVYDNNPATGYAVGYIYNIKLELKAGKNTLYLGHYEEYGKGGRMNLDGFYIQKWEESAEVTTTAAPETTTAAPVTTAKPADTTAKPTETPKTADMNVVVLAAAAAMLTVVVAMKRRAK